MKSTTIDRITDTVSRIVNGTHESLRSGMPFRIPDAWCAGDCGAQGDLIFVIVDSVPSGYVRVERPTEADKQLVHGNTQGSRHCIDSLDGVELYRPANWSEDSLDGPVVHVTEDRVVTHPTHGQWTIPSGRTIKFEYPRVWDAEERKSRRNAD